MSLSSTLYSRLSDGSEIDDRSKEAYRWIWYWLMSNMSAEKLNNALQEIQEEIKSRNYTPQVLAELAWKAEVVEQLIDAN
jgi:hypothetical protein